MEKTFMFDIVDMHLKIFSNSKQHVEKQLSVLTKMSALVVVPMLEYSLSLVLYRLFYLHSIGRSCHLYNTKPSSQTSASSVRPHFLLVICGVRLLWK